MTQKRLDWSNCSFPCMAFYSIPNPFLSLRLTFADLGLTASSQATIYTPGWRKTVRVKYMYNDVDSHYWLEFTCNIPSLIPVPRSKSPSLISKQCSLPTQQSSLLFSDNNSERCKQSKYTCPLTESMEKANQHSVVHRNMYRNWKGKHLGDLSFPFLAIKSWNCLELSA